jgi:hypothetical protein
MDEVPYTAVPAPAEKRELPGGAAVDRPGAGGARQDGFAEASPVWRNCPAEPAPSRTQAVPL